MQEAPKFYTSHMECVVSPDGALLLDRLFRSPGAATLVFDSTAGLSVQVAAPDMSQLKLVRLEPSFFEHVKLLNLVISMPFQRFYIANMRSLRILQRENSTVLEYALEGCRYTKVVDNTEGDVLDPEFEAACSIAVDLQPLREVLRSVRAKYVKIAIGESVRIFYEGTEVRLGRTAEPTLPVEFRVETEAFRGILYYADMYSDYSMSLSDEMDCLNAVFRGPDSVVSIYIALQDCLR